ncbi:uncharacterized protein LOC124167068 isoform X2 [Ischnura elegans]|uniref:uncharacterized protein LOC124167068 isoform X2 n=1 Tax=Ischnura elegans TaxID=197161 RepID=UPI001ED87D6E|nr:uncharacterized protein LOC124167068 isoform X2 [Ischnura elegans]
MPTDEMAGNNGSPALPSSLLTNPREASTEPLADFSPSKMPHLDLNLRSLLHQAVVTGQLRWVQKVLDNGHDPSARVNDSCDVVKLAEDMCAKHPGNAERRSIARLLRETREKMDLVMGRKLNMCDIPKGKEDILQSFEELVKGVVSSELNKFADTINTSVSSRLTALESGLSKGIDSVREASVNVSQSVAGVREEQTNLVSKVNDLWQSRQKGTARAADDDKFATKLYNILSLVEAATKETSAKINVMHAPTLRNQCIESMMSKTYVSPNNDSNRSKMETMYRKMYDKDPALSTVLQFLHLHPSVKVFMDLDSKRIGTMKSTVTDHDGKERKGNEYRSFADLKAHEVYLTGGRPQDNWTEAFASRSLAQLAVQLVFENEGRPYSGGDGVLERKFKEILAELERKKADGEDLDSDFTSWALTMETQLSKEIHLYAVVPSMIADYGPSKARSKLAGQSPSLLEYYETHVMTTLKKETKKMLERKAEWLPLC